jgi:hypothetical protein
MSSTLSELVREQILAEGPEYLADVIPMMREDYITAQLDNMSNSQLLERISDAIDRRLIGMSVRLGI